MTHPCVRRLATLALFVLFACASDDIPVSTNYDPLVEFPASSTYVWDDAQNQLPKNPEIDAKSTAALLRSVIDEAFAARNWHAVTGTAPYRLSYQFSIHTFRGVDVSTATGSLSLLLSDHESGRRVWTGFGQAEVFVGLTPEERRARLRDAMERMLQNFPPAQRPR